MVREYAVQVRNKEYSTKWDDYADIFDTEKEAKKAFNDQLSRNKSYGREKRITRMVSFIVTDTSVPVRERPANGCTIIAVLEYHEDK